MALNRAKREAIPSDGVVLTKTEAFQYQSKLMQSWKYKSDTLGYRCGTGLLGGLAAATGVYLNNYYRTKLRIGKYGRITSYLPIVAIPAMCTMAFHVQYVIPGVTLQTDCPVCIETRAAAIQAALGSIVPTILAPLSAFPLAVQYSTYNLPYVTREPRKVFEVWRKLSKPISNILLLLFVGQAVAGALIAHWEAKSVHTVHRKLMELEKSLDEQYGHLG